MNRSILLKCLALFFSIIQFGQFESSQAALSGNYVIDANAAASTNNYQSLTAFVQDLQTGSRSDGGTPNGPGISASVVASITSGSGPYNEQVNIGAISGVSANSTITIDGNGELVTFTASGSDEKHVFCLDSASFITIRNFKVKFKYTQGGRNFHITRKTHNCVIEDCSLTQVTDSAINNSAFIAMSAKRTSLSDSGDVAGWDMIFRNNTLSNLGTFHVNYGIYIGYPIGDTNIYQNQIINNSIRDFSDGGIYGLSVSHLLVKGNEIFENIPDKNCRLIYLQCDKNRMVNTIDSNYIHDFHQGETPFLRPIEVQASQSIGQGDLVIKNNRIVGTGLHKQLVGNQVAGIYLFTSYSKLQGRLVIDNNQINLSVDSNNNDLGIYGIQLTALTCNNLTSVNTTNNKVLINNSVNMFGIYHYVYGCKLTDSLTVVSNNLVASNRCHGGTALYMIASQIGLGVYYNTIAINQSDSNFVFIKGMYVKSDRQYEVLNNLLFAKAEGGTVLGMEFNGINEPKVDHNCFFLSGNKQDPIYAIGGKQGTVMEFDSFMDKYSLGNDIEADPQFKDFAGMDYTPTNTDAMDKAKPLSRIKTDIYRHSRDSMHPDMGAIETVVDTSTTDTTIGIPQLFSNDVSSFHFFPNPAENELLVVRKGIKDQIEFAIYDGKGVQQMNFELQSGQNRKTIDIGELSPGIYFIVSTAASRREVKRLLIE